MWDAWMMTVGTPATGIVFRCNKRIEMEYAKRMDDRNAASTTAAREGEIAIFAIIDSLVSGV